MLRGNGGEVGGQGRDDRLSYKACRGEGPTTPSSHRAGYSLHRDAQRGVKATGEPGPAPAGKQWAWGCDSEGDVTWSGWSGCGLDPNPGGPGGDAGGLCPSRNWDLDRRTDGDGNVPAYQATIAMHGRDTHVPMQSVVRPRSRGRHAGWD